jgi:adenylate cyclase
MSMVVEERKKPQEIEEVWQTYLVTGDVPDYLGHPWYASKRLRPLFLHLPADPRCKYCYYPFEGFGGQIMRRVFGIAPSRLNPHLCNLCERFLEENPGGAEVETTVLFADVRGSTSLAEQMSPTEYGRLINRFYNTAAKILFESGAMIEKLIGDAVTAFYTSGFPAHDHARVAVADARAIMKATGHDRPSEPWIPVGIGIHTGRAYIGTVAADSGVSDIVVLGDTANTGARLASLAAAGEILVSQVAAGQAGLDSSGVEKRRLELKGRNEPLEVWAL